MNLPNIQSQHPNIYSEFIRSCELEQEAANLIKQSQQIRINALNQLRMQLGWTKTLLAKTIGFQAQFFFRIEQGHYPMKEKYLEKVDEGLNVKLTNPAAE